MATTRLALTTPSGADLIKFGDDAITANANILDNAAIYKKGTHSARPAANTQPSGTLYYETDTKTLFHSDASVWSEISSGLGSPPVGVMMDWPVLADPTDTRWLLADGRAISRTTYATLFGLISTIHGAGDGSTTFNIPDCRGRQAISPDNMGTARGAAGRFSNSTIGASGGAETLALATANIPAHTHGPGTLATNTVADHTHGVGTFDTAMTSTGTVTGTISSDSAGTPAGTVANSATLSTNTETSDHTHAGTTDNDTTDHHHTVPNATGSGTGWGLTGGVSSASNTNTSGRSSSHSHTYTTGGRSSAHTHTINPHSHGFTGTAMGTHSHTFTADPMSTNHNHAITGASAAGGGHSHTLTSGVTASTGSGTAFSVMGPWIVLPKIIKVS